MGKITIDTRLAIAALVVAIIGLGYAHQQTSISVRQDEVQRSASDEHTAYALRILKNVRGKTYCVGQATEDMAESYETEGDRTFVSFYHNARNAAWRAELSNPRYDERNNGLTYDLEGQESESIYLTEGKGGSIFNYSCNGGPGNYRCTGLEMDQCRSVADIAAWRRASGY